MKHAIEFPVEKPVEYRPRIIKLAAKLNCTPKEAQDMLIQNSLRIKGDNDDE